MGLSFGHIALLLIIVLVVFGAGRLPQVMGDLAKGLRSFKDGLKEGEEEASPKQMPLIAATDPTQNQDQILPISSGNDNAESPDRREA